MGRDHHRRSDRPTARRARPHGLRGDRTGRPRRRGVPIRLRQPPTRLLRTAEPVRNVALGARVRSHLVSRRPLRVDAVLLRPLPLLGLHVLLRGLGQHPIRVGLGPGKPPPRALAPLGASRTLLRWPRARICPRERSRRPLAVPRPPTAHGVAPGSTRRLRRGSEVRPHEPRPRSGSRSTPHTADSLRQATTGNTPESPTTRRASRGSTSDAHLPIAGGPDRGTPRPSGRRPSATAARRRGRSRRHTSFRCRQRGRLTSTIGPPFVRGPWSARGAGRQGRRAAIRATFRPSESRALVNAAASAATRRKLSTSDAASFA